MHKVCLVDILYISLITLGRIVMTKPAKRKKKYTTHAAPTIRISLTISPELVELVDKAAKQDYTTRSDIIRMSILWYLRPQGRELDQTDPDTIIKTLKPRKARA